MDTNQEDIFREIIENMYDGVYLVDPQRRILFWNKAAERISGFPAEKVIGSHCFDNILNHVTENGTQLCQTGCPLHATLADGQVREAEVFLHHADGHRVPILVRTAALKDREGKITGAVEVFSDNSLLFSTRHHMRKLQETVSLDPLTGIGNRRRMETRLQYALAEFQQHRLRFGILFIDIDYFKRVNDTHGHDVGDQVLRMVANTLRKNIRGDDTVARWGGEEFIVLLSNIELEGLEAVAEKLRVLIKASSITVNGKPLHVTISIGGALIRQEDDIPSLLRRADQNMYQSKLAGRDRVTCDSRAGEAQ
jgi:diguanylate cyclase (GGDEF)-like protein/PAS domain S-box-containing protein